MGKLYGWMTVHKVRSDAKGTMMVMPACPPAQAPMDNYELLKNQQHKSLWRMHLREVVEKRGNCRWDDCPGKLTSKGICPRSNMTHMCCEECSARLGQDIYLCNRYIKGVLVNFQQYHIYHHTRKNASTMVIN